ncbi:MAG: hypothetical protein ACTSYO_09415 [Candidatus Ranarchaeia archaeon]
MNTDIDKIQKSNNQLINHITQSTKFFRKLHLINAITIEIPYLFMILAVLYQIYNLSIQLVTQTNISNIQSSIQSIALISLIIVLLKIAQITGKEETNFFSYLNALLKRYKKENRSHVADNELGHYIPIKILSDVLNYFKNTGTTTTIYLFTTIALSVVETLLLLNFSLPFLLSLLLFGIPLELNAAIGSLIMGFLFLLPFGWLLLLSLLFLEYRFWKHVILRGKEVGEELEKTL